ncbi:RNA-binding motif protein, X-linked 2 [Varanus komodoensis]|nr:RNA-binding motif protein, X-linked 2 [Varanus komodoensis]
MRPLTKVKLINELNEREAQLGVQDKVSWHAEYKDSAWVFVGGLPYELTEGDIICVFSQYGEIVNINLVRDKKTGKSKGFCFICYEDQRSTILAVDNFNGIKIKGRTIRVDHVANYRPPKDSEDIDDVTKALREKGCGVKTPPPSSSESSEDTEVEVKKHKKEKNKKKKKEKREHRKRVKEEPPVDAPPSKTKIKVEKEDPGYDRYASTSQPVWSKASGHKHTSRLQQEQDPKYERTREGSPERGTDRDRQEQRTPYSEKHKKADASKERLRASESRRSRERWESRDKPSRDKKSSSRY